MDKGFFTNFAERKKRFEDQVGDPNDVRGQVGLLNGRAFIVDEVIAAEDAWVELLARDASDEENVMSVTVPYHQIGSVVFLKKRSTRGGTGFIK